MQDYIELLYRTKLTLLVGKDGLVLQKSSAKNSFGPLFALVGMLLQTSATRKKLLLSCPCGTIFEPKESRSERPPRLFREDPIKNLFRKSNSSDNWEILR